MESGEKPVVLTSIGSSSKTSTQTASILLPSKVHNLSVNANAHGRAALALMTLASCSMCLAYFGRNDSYAALGNSPTRCHVSNSLLLADVQVR